MRLSLSISSLTAASRECVQEMNEPLPVPDFGSSPQNADDKKTIAPEPRRTEIEPFSVPCFTWEALSGGERQVMIRYQGQHYCLRETRNGKLILTK